MNKKEIRKIIINNRKRIKKNEWSKKSFLINQNIIQKFNFGNKKIGIYFPINNEIFLHDLFNLKNNKIYLPKTKNNRIEFCKYINNEKINQNELLRNPKKYNLIYEQKTFQPKIKCGILIPEIIFVPLVAFNSNCFRIGYGGGFYDRYLRNKSIIKIGVAFEMQKVEFLPESHDVQLDYIITEKNLYRKKCNNIFLI